MVERYTLTSLDEMAAIFVASLRPSLAPVVASAVPPALPASAFLAASPPVAPRFNIAPLQIAPICIASGLVTARWGLLPPWRGHGGKRGAHIIHAPVDSLEHVPVLRNAFRSQRCLVLADGFFLWQRTGKKTQPIWLHPRAGPERADARSRTIAFAGIAATHRDDGQRSFAIVVGPASSVAAPFTPTVPMVIPADGYDAWLSGPRDRARDLLAVPGSDWRADPASDWVNSANHDDPRCVQPLRNPAQGELF